MDGQTKPSCLLLTTQNEFFAASIELFARQYFDVRLASRHSWEECRITPEIAQIVDGGVDYLFSFLSPIIVPQAMLDKTKRLNINVHPAPPEYPGIGAASLALYDNRKTFGATAHIMEEKVDTGRILSVKRVPVYENDTCETLDSRARLASVSLMEEIMAAAAKDKLPVCEERWQGTVMTRKKFRQWMTLPPDATEEEVNRKIRALRHRTFPGPFVTFHGHIFGYREDYNK